MEWLVAIDACREIENLTSEVEIEKRIDSGIAELKRRRPGIHHQGMFVGCENTFERGEQTYHLRIYSHVVEQGVVDVEVTGSCLVK